MCTPRDKKTSANSGVESTQIQKFMMRFRVAYNRAFGCVLLFYVSIGALPCNLNLSSTRW